MQTARSYFNSIGLYPEHIDSPVFTLPNTQHMINSVRISAIIHTICAFKEVDEVDLKSPKRFRPLAEGRYLCFHFLRENNLGTFSGIGRMFNRDHTSVMHGVKTIADLRHSDGVFNGEVERLTLIINKMIAG